MKILICQWIISFIVFFPLVLSAQNNAGKNKYELNDPRNPDCPCHKLQKQAEEEYAQQHRQVSPPDNVNSAQVMSQVQNSLYGNSISEHSMVSKHRRKKIAPAKFNNLRFRFTKKMNRVKTCRPDYSVCYKW